MFLGSLRVLFSRTINFDTFCISLQHHHHRPWRHRSLVEHHKIMGNKYSTPASASPSAAFGRLRITDRRILRQAHDGGGTASGSASPYGPSSPAAAFVNGRLLARPSSLERRLYSVASGLSEQSPLLRLESLPSSESLLDKSIGTPAFVMWIGPALICALCYAHYNIFIKKGSASIHPVLGGVILQFIAAIVGSALLAVLVLKDGVEETISYDMVGVYWAILAGVAVGTAEILSFVVSGMGVQSMQSIRTFVFVCLLAAGVVCCRC
jgi:hypothetical protein